MSLLDRFPRRIYTPEPTPLEPLDRLSASLGGPRIWIKRDDLLGLTQGGNKTRKLEFLIADALAQGADTLITVGGVQSNHCRLTLAAAVREGLACELILEEDPGPDGTALPGGVGANPPAYDGNFLLFDLLGAERVTVLANGADLLAAAEARAAELRASGRSVYVIPVGGSSPIGALGYVAGAQELLGQLAGMGLSPAALIAPSGSAGMQSGLIVGCQAAGSGLPVIGVNVSRGREAQEARVRGLVAELTALLGLPTVPGRQIVALGDWVGAGYTLPTDAMRAAVRLFARTEGILLDPVYTGKAAAGMIDLIRRGDFADASDLVFLHSGGIPGLYSRAAYFAAP